VVKAPRRLIEEIGSTMIIEEILSVGAGIGGGFEHTSELIPMKYHEAMKKDPKGWGKAVPKEHERMAELGVFQPIDKNQVPKNAKILTSTWSMKLKADGTKRARLNARNIEQITGEHYNETGVSSPIVNEASIFILLTLMVMAQMYGELNDVKGAFFTWRKIIYESPRRV